jgi:hypothetical protein
MSNKYQVMKVLRLRFPSFRDSRVRLSGRPAGGAGVSLSMDHWDGTEVNPVQLGTYHVR